MYEESFPHQRVGSHSQTGRTHVGDNLNTCEADLESPYLSSVWPVFAIDFIPKSLVELNLVFLDDMFIP